MPVFRIPAGLVHRLAATLLLPAFAAGCAAADPRLPELKPAASAKSATASSAFDGYMAFAPEPRDDWRQASMAAGGMAMDHASMDHSMMQPATPAPEDKPGAAPPAHKH